MRNEVAKDFTQQLMTQQLKEFKSFMKSFKSKDDEIERIFESGKEPSAEITDKFESMKQDFADFMNYFKNNDSNLWDSVGEVWTPLSVANTIVYNTYNGIEDTITAIG